MSISNTPSTSADPFMDFIKSAALLFIPEARPGVLYTTEQICVAVWDSLDNGEHIHAGRALSYLVETGQLPLVADGKTSSNWNLYRLR